MELVKWFEKGVSEAEYINSMQQHKENLLSIKNRFSLTSVEKSQSLSEKNLRAIVITADWCGDAMVNLPIFMSIAREGSIETRYLIRDENLELMDRYLTNGMARSIPIIILIDENGNEYARWGPRAEIVQSYVDDYKQSLPPKDDESFNDAFNEYINKFTTLFNENTELWTSIEDDMLRAFVK